MPCCRSTRSRRAACCRGSRVLLDLPPAAGRARGQEGGSDYLEREALAFHERVREGYLAMAEAEPERWLVLDALRPAEELTREVWGRTAGLLRGA